MDDGREDDAGRPDVDRVEVVLQFHEQFGRLEEAGGDLVAHGGLRVELLGQSEVGQLELAGRRVVEEVLGLDVAVDDPFGVHVVQDGQQLVHVPLERVGGEVQPVAFEVRVLDILGDDGVDAGRAVVDHVQEPHDLFRVLHGHHHRHFALEFPLVDWLGHPA